MCFDLDSRPPISPIAGGALDHDDLVLTASDGNRFAAFRARAADASGAGIVILPDVRGLHPYYEELALRFAEAGVDALAIDYFGRTAGVAKRDGAFEYMPHVGQTTAAGLRADVTAAATALRSDGARVGTLFTTGFCMGGRLAYLSMTYGLDLAGTIAFYGWPAGGRSTLPAPADVAAEMRGTVLGIFGGADEGIPAEDVTAFEAALTQAGAVHELVTYPGAPHSFFDRKAAEFAEASADAWRRTLDLVRANTPA